MHIIKPSRTVSKARSMPLMPYTLIAIVRYSIPSIAADDINTLNINQSV